MNPVLLVPISVLAFLFGIASTTRRKGLSMLPPDKTKSPLPGIIMIRWIRFTNIMARSPKQTVTARRRYGAFGMEPRRLGDLGLMSKPKKMTMGKELGVWVGEWKAPLTEQKFLGSLPIQYATFTRSMKRMTPKVGKFVGCNVDGVKCSLSGLLGVGHMAGEAGVESWVKDPKVRQKFKPTTETFKLTNGIF